MEVSTLRSKTKTLEENLFAKSVQKNLIAMPGDLIPMLPVQAPEFKPSFQPNNNLFQPNNNIGWAFSKTPEEFRNFRNFSDI